MLRRIIKINQDKCSGCGLCVQACHEGAIGLVEGKARLMREDYCDGLGDCLPACPENPITFEEREAPANNEAAVLAAKQNTINPHFFNGADLLLAAYCASYAYGSFHEDFIRGRVTLIGCPKLDQTDYAEKLAEIIAANDIKSITVARMQVPCCGGLENAVKRALLASGKSIPCKVAVISTDGRLPG